MILKKILVVDLDGTLISVNTFHKWLKFSLGYFLMKGDFLAVGLISLSIGLRIIRLITHKRLKYLILKVTKTVEECAINQFVGQIIKHQNPLDKYLNVNSKFDVTILATAAPELYAIKISDYYGFDFCFGTKQPNGDFCQWTENIREAKLDSLQSAYLNGNFFEIDTLITDHKDDYPLMRISNKIILVNPSLSTEAFVNQKSITYELLKI